MESETEFEQTVLMVLKVPFNLNSRVRKFEVRLGPPGGDKGYKVRKIIMIVLVIITMITRAINKVGLKIMIIVLVVITMW